MKEELQVAALLYISNVYVHCTGFVCTQILFEHLHVLTA